MSNSDREAFLHFVASMDEEEASSFWREARGQEAERKNKQQVAADAVAQYIRGTR